MSQTHAPNRATVHVYQRFPEEQEQREELWTVREVAKQLRVDETTVRRWIKSGALGAITLPHRGYRQAYRIRQSTMNALLKGNGHGREA